MTGNPYHDETGRFCSKEEMGAAVERIFEAASGATGKAQREGLMQQWFTLKSEYEQFSSVMPTSQQALTGAWEDVQASIAALPVEEQLAAVHRFRVSLGDVQTPIAEISGHAAKVEEQLIERKWAEAEPRDYLALDDYRGLQKLTEDASWGNASAAYQENFVTGLDPHIMASGTYDGSRMLPMIEVRLASEEEEEGLVKLADTLRRWSTFTIRHRGDESNGQYAGEGSELDEYFDEEAGDSPLPPSHTVGFFTNDAAASGIPQVAIYEDGSAFAYMQVYGSIRGVDAYGKPSYGEDIEQLYAKRKPLAELLGELSKVWYYGEGKSSRGARYSDWDDDSDTY